MACSAWLHSSSLSHTLLPVLCRQTTISTIFLRFNRLSSAARFFSSIGRTNALVFALAKRRDGSLSLKEDLVASPADLHFEPPLKIVDIRPELRARNQKNVSTFEHHLKKLVDGYFDLCIVAFSCSLFYTA
ncbi:peptide deformylase 1B, chloroplastic/mitochondrial-like [Pistacia vera]|uniref:peptide deformylase 1B, chloroplastic/mitochondrial-like n=1 Tax=Pistacia vera TaxID=55513 RepID=UPI0012630E27|nr:peptide deformylase 1B, chloroplastic/mitochondrial-like [Pistacia vera]